VVNKVAMMREVARVEAYVPPIKPQKIKEESTRISVVVPEGIRTPKLPKNFRICLVRGEWGKVFMGLMQGIQTPIQITEDTIDSIFNWGNTVIGQCKASYMQMIIDLLQLPSGISLFRDIIIAHHCMPNLPKVRFVEKNMSSCITSFDYNRTSEINLRWDRLTRRYVCGTRVIVAVDNSLPAVVGQPGKQLTFANAEVPPSLVLAHELGHYLYNLVACKNIMDSYVNSHHDIVSGAIASNVGARAVYDRKMSSMFRTYKLMDSYAYKEYSEILAGIVTHTPPTVAEMAFIDLWNHGNYSEVVNILPGANILGTGGSNYSDGVILGEAFLDPTCVIYGQIAFSDSTNSIIPNINTGGAALTAESFVAF
jgi:hypothetical protein